MQSTEGNAGQWSNVFMASIPRTTGVPRAPTGLTATVVSASSISLSWTTPTVGSATQIDWSTDSDSGSIDVGAQLGTSLAYTYTHTGLRPGTEYTYRVRAKNVNGLSLAEVRSATTSTAPVTSGLPQVADLQLEDVSTDKTKLKLTWTAVANATHYEILRFSNSTGAWTAPAAGNGLVHRMSAGQEVGRIGIGNSAVPSWVDEDGALKPGTTYYYVVSAVIVINTVIDDMGPWSAYEGITTNAPLAGIGGVGLHATGMGPDTILLTWNEVQNATSYTIAWRNHNTGQTGEIPNLTGTSYRHTELSHDSVYYYRIRGVNSSGMTEWSQAPDQQEGETRGKTWKSELPPPSNVTAAGDTQRNAAGEVTAYQIEVSWDSVGGASAYHLQRWDTGQNEWVNPANGMKDEWLNVGNTTSHPDVFSESDLERDPPVLADAAYQNTRYYYRVRSMNKNQTSAWSQIASGRTGYAKVSTPRTLVAASTGMTMIRLSWTTLDIATSYVLEFVEGEANAETDFASASALSLTPDNSHHIHSGLTAGTLYSYRLKAIQPEGVETDWSATATRYTKPAQPQLTVSGRNATSLALAWDAVPFDDGHGVDNQGYLPASAYKVERRASGQSAWTLVTIKTVDADCTTAGKCTLVDTGKYVDGSDEVQDPGLTSNTQYYYRIRAEVTRDSIGYVSYWDYANQWTTAE